MREYVARLLEPYYHVDLAADGMAALDIVKKNAPDLVLSDIMMPHLDGIGLLRGTQMTQLSLIPSFT
jgi:CheY-like chemotaxis protein